VRSTRRATSAGSRLASGSPAAATARAWVDERSGTQAAVGSGAAATGRSGRGWPARSATSRLAARPRRPMAATGSSSYQWGSVSWAALSAPTSRATSAPVAAPRASAMSTSRGWLAAAAIAQGWRRAQAATQSSRSSGWARSRPSLARLTGAMASTTSSQPAR
jgi:hypothetical protein